MTTAAPYRLEILRHVDQTHGDDYWVWSLIAADGDHREGGRIDNLAGLYDLGGVYGGMYAERVAEQVCHQSRVDRDSVALFLMKR